MTRLSEEDNCLNENLLRMPTSPPGAVAVGFADSAEPEFHAQCDKPVSVQFIHEVPSEPNAVSEDTQEENVPKIGEKSGRKSQRSPVKQLSFFKD